MERAVCITSRSLSFYAPLSSQMRFHDWDDRDWMRTRCGRRLWVKGQQAGVAVRRDTADLIAYPCIVCWRGR